MAFVEEVLPPVLVVGASAALAIAVFGPPEPATAEPDAPREAPARLGAARSGVGVPGAPSFDDDDVPPSPPSAEAPPEPPLTQPRGLLGAVPRGLPAEDGMNPVLARVIRNLSISAEEDAPDPALGGSITRLAEAVKAVRSARTEEDLVHAEEVLRSARKDLEDTCGAPGSPLCQSVESIRDLGY